MISLEQLNQMNDIYLGRVPFTWKQFLKCKLILSCYIKRTVGGENKKIYRASFIKESDEQINLKSRYVNPRPELTERGRCNLKGHPVFYGASCLLGAIQEAIITKNDPNILNEYNHIMYVSEWEIIEPQNFFVYDTRHDLKISYGKREEVFRSTYLKLINKIFTSIKGHEISSNLSFFLMYGSKQEGKEPDKLYPPPGVENCKFIFYPSVVRDGKFINIAIHPSIIYDNTLSLVKIFKIALPSIKDELIKCPEEVPFEHLKKSLNSINFDYITNSDNLSFEVLKIGVPSGISGDIINWREPVKEDYEYT